MRADIGDATALTGLRRVSAPSGLLLAGMFDWFGQPVLQIFDLHMAHAPDATRRDQRARLSDHRIAGVSLGQDEGQASFGH